MSDFQVLTSSPSAADSAAAAARLTRRRSLVVTNDLAQWAAEGRLFIAGEGIEATHIDSLAALDDTTPTYGLKAPASGTVVIPVYLELDLTTEGGAAPDVQITYVASNIAWSAGTTFPSVRNLLSSGSHSPLASIQHTITSGAITTAQNVVVGAAVNLADNMTSAESINTGGAVGLAAGLSKTTLVWKPNYPILLHNGGALLIYTYTATSDSKWRPTIVWAEVPEAQVL